MIKALNDIGPPPLDQPPLLWEAFSDFIEENTTRHVAIPTGDGWSVEKLRNSRKHGLFSAVTQPLASQAVRSAAIKLPNVCWFFLAAMLQHCCASQQLERNIMVRFFIFLRFLIFSACFSQPLLSHQLPSAIIPCLVCKEYILKITWTFSSWMCSLQYQCVYQ